MKCNEIRLLKIYSMQYYARDNNKLVNDYVRRLTIQEAKTTIDKIKPPLEDR